MKHHTVGKQTTGSGSPPMRGRGLKPLSIILSYLSIPVASHAGAWIETARLTCPADKLIVASHAGAWIETNISTVDEETTRVASHAGAWIETLALNPVVSGKGSPPMRGRGLKPLTGCIIIEKCRSPPMRGRGLKLLEDKDLQSVKKVASHAGAWIETRRKGKVLLDNVESPPMRGRGLKQHRQNNPAFSISRLPCGGVD